MTIEIVDSMQKLINSEYSVEASRKVIIGGLKCYAILLWIETTTHGWKLEPKNIRMAKLIWKKKKNSFKGKADRFS